jgi:glucose-6-phosphate isomerase
MSWTRFTQNTYQNAELGFALDYSRIPFPDDFFATMEPAAQRAYSAMAELEQGAIANPDEGRMVGHYWLRAAKLAPTPALTRAIDDSLAQIHAFAAEIHTGRLLGSTGKKFTRLLVIGIGGSALGPQLVNHALGQPGADKMAVSFFDNTDPDGIDYVLAQLTGHLPETLVIVISKSGGTAETRNGMLEAAAAFTAAGLSYPKHYVAVTGDGSKLDQTALKEGWLARFPMWDWVGGRTSELCTVGLLPAALQGIDITALLHGAAEMDAITRSTTTRENPAALLALMWHYATEGRGAKDMVILPYKDRLLLFSRYLQQLVMESLGKEFDLAGNLVNQGIAVYGNKGSTDQHAYVQQLREGVNNFFVTFIQVLKDRANPTAALQVEPGITAGDYLLGFYLGTRTALSEKDRASLSLTIAELTPRSLGHLIALYERAVGFYANLVGINAYHQPGVEAGKKAATGVIALQQKLVAALQSTPGQAANAEELTAQVGGDPELAYKILEHLSANGSLQKKPQSPWFKTSYYA